MTAEELLKKQQEEEAEREAAQAAAQASSTLVTPQKAPGKTGIVTMRPEGGGQAPTQEQSFALHQNQAARATKTTVVKAGDLTKLNPALEGSRTRYDEANKAGNMRLYGATDYGANEIKVDYTSIKDNKQAALFFTTLETDKDIMKAVKRYAEVSGQDANKVLAEAEQYLSGTFGRELFSVPQTDGGKMRAANKALESYGLINSAGEPIDIYASTPQQVINSLHMNPDDDVRKDAYKAIKILQKTPGSAWYGMELTESDLGFMDDAVLTKKDYNEAVSEMETAFTHSDKPTKENIGAYLELLDDIKKQHKDNPRVYAYMKAALDKTYSARNGSYAPPDADTAQKLLDALEKEGMLTRVTDENGQSKTVIGFGIENEPGEGAGVDTVTGATVVQAFETYKQKNDGAKDTVDAIDQETDAKNAKDKEYAGGVITEDKDGNYIIHGPLNDDVIGTSGGAQTPAAAEAPQLPIMTGGEIKIGGQTLRVNPGVASAFVSDVIPMSVYRNTPQMETPGEGFNPAGLSQETLDKYRKKGEVQGPAWPPPKATSAAEQLTRDLGQFSTQTWKPLEYDPNMTDAQALLHWSRGDQLAPENEAKIADYINDYQFVKMYRTLMDGSVTVGDSFKQNVTVYGERIGWALDALTTGALDDESMVTGMLMLNNIRKEIDSIVEGMDETVGRDIIIPHGKNQYDYVFGMRPDLLDQVNYVYGLRDEFNAARAQDKLDKAEEKEAIYDQYMAAEARGEGTPEMAAWLALNGKDEGGAAGEGWRDDETLGKYLEETYKGGRLYAKNGGWFSGAQKGDFWNGDSSAAKQAAVIAKSDEEAAYEFMGMVNAETQTLLEAMCYDAHSNDQTLGEWLPKFGITSIDQVAELAYNNMVRTGNVLMGDEEVRQALGTIDVSFSTAAALGQNAATVYADSQLTETPALIVDKAVHDANKISIRNKMWEVYDSDAPMMTKRRLYGLLNGAELSEESKEKLKARLDSGEYVFDVAADYLDLDGLQKWLHDQTNAKQNEAEDLMLIGSYLNPKDKAVFDALNMTAGMASYMSLSTLGTAVTGNPLAGAAIAGFPGIADTYENYIAKGASEGEAGFMALMHWGVEAALNMGGNQSALDDMFGNEKYIDGLVHALRGGSGGKQTLLTAAKYQGTALWNMAKHGIARGVQEAGEEGGEFIASTGLEMAFDAYYAESQALKSGEGMSVGRLMTNIIDAVGSNDPVELGTELLENFGAGGIMGFFFSVGGSLRMTGAAFADYRALNKYQSVQMMQELYEGKLPGTEEDIGSIALQLRADLKDPKFVAWLDGHSKMRRDLKNVGAAVAEGAGIQERRAAAEIAAEANELNKRAEAADAATAEAQTHYDELVGRVEAGETDLIPAMEAAQTTWSRSAQATNELMEAARKKGKQAEELAQRWMDAVLSATETIGAEDLSHMMDGWVAQTFEIARTLYERQQAAVNAADHEAWVEETFDMAHAMQEEEQAATEAQELADYEAGQAAEEEARIAEEAELEAQVDAENEAKAQEEAIAAEEEAVGQMTDEEIDAEIAEIARAEARYDEATAQAGEMGYDEETLSALKEQTDADAQAKAARREAIIRNQRNQYKSLTDRADQAVQLGDADAQAELLKQRQAVQARIEALGAEIEDPQANAPEPSTTTPAAMPQYMKDAKAAKQMGGENAPEPSTQSAPAKPVQKPDPRKEKRDEIIADLVTGTTKAERDAKAAEEQAEKNVAAMDVEELIEQRFPNASDEYKAHVRETYEAIKAEKAAVQAGTAVQNPAQETGSKTPSQPANASNKRNINNAIKFAGQVKRRFGVNTEIVKPDHEKLKLKPKKFAAAAYDPETDTIYVSENATQGDIIRAKVVHELTHRIEGTEGYKEFAEAVKSAYFKGNENNEKSTRNRIKSKYSNAGVELTPDALEGELVAYAVEKLIGGDQDMVNRIVADSPSVARRIMDAIRRVLSKLSGVKDAEIDQMKKVENMFRKALDESKKQKDGTTQTRDARPDAVDAKTGNVLTDTIGKDTEVKHSLSSWTTEEEQIVRKNLIDKGFDPDEVDNWIDDANSIAAIIAADRDRLDFKAVDNQEMLKPNQEYVKTLDASTLCAKRLLYQGTFNEIQHAMPDHVFTSEELLDLLNLMKDEGYETPCGVCYVESRRRHLGKFAQEWLDGYDANGGYQPKLDDVTTTDGLERMRHDHPEVYKSFTDAMSKKGSANPKVVQLRTDYRGDIRKMSKGDIKKIIKIGGLRVQSFSDFETPHLLDMMQAVLDMTEKGLTSQAYTKVPNFAWVFGDTGIKINLSLMAEGSGVDENGNLIFSSTEGMDIDDAMRLRDRYSENVGTIIVGANDAHIRAAMADPRIDYIIPFHKSGWGQNEINKVGVLRTYENYENYQNERVITGYHKNGNPKYGRPKGGNFYPIDYWDYSKTGDENAKAYLRMCEEDGRIPKFEQFLTKDADGHWVAPSGYWKMLIDFKMYDNDGVGAPQKPVRPIFNMEEARRVLGEYKGGANELPVARDIVDRFVNEIRGKGNVQYSLDEEAESDDDFLRAEIEAWMEDENRVSAGKPAPKGDRQFATKTLQNNENVPDWIKETFLNDPERRNYSRESNMVQLGAAWNRIQTEGRDAVIDRLLNQETTFTPEDNADALVLMSDAMHNDDMDTFMAIATKYGAEGTEQGKALQIRSLMRSMSPTGFAQKVVKDASRKLRDHMDTHKEENRKLAKEAKQIRDRLELDKKYAGNTVKQLTEEGKSVRIDNKWGAPLNEQKLALIEEFDLEKVARPGLFYNWATIKQRMLEDILTTDDVFAEDVNGMNLVDRLIRMKYGQPVVTKADIAYITEQMGIFNGLADQNSREADLALSRAYEAQGNISPATGKEKRRTWRYVSMLLSLASAGRNIIGNAAQNIVNFGANEIAVGVDYAISKATGRDRTRAQISAADMAKGWEAFVAETKNTFKDYFVDKTITQHGEGRYNQNQRGRTYENQVVETLRRAESLMMSVGDRNFWRMKFLNSLAEQQRLAEINGTKFDMDAALETAEAEANYATFNEDNAVRSLFNGLKDVPAIGTVVDFVMPFTGVPTNIIKRQFEFSPIGFAYTAVKHGLAALGGADFDQRAFVDGMARGLTGSALMMVGALMLKMGWLKLGTKEEENEKDYGVRTAQGDQYGVYFTIGDKNYSITTFSPAASALVAGAFVGDALKDNERWYQAVVNGTLQNVNEIFDASYMASLGDLLDTSNGKKITDNFIPVVGSAVLSQNIPAPISHLASSLDPYVRDTKDKDALTEVLKTTMSKLPYFRGMLPEKVDVAGRAVENTKYGGAAFVDPFTTSKVVGDPVLDEMIRLRDELIKIDHDEPRAHMATDVLSGRKNTLKQNGVTYTVSDEEKEAYRKRYGDLWRNGGETYTAKGKRIRVDSAAELIASRKYQKMSDTEKAKALNKIVLAAKNGATYEIMNHM